MILWLKAATTDSISEKFTDSQTKTGYFNIAVSS